MTCNNAYTEAGPDCTLPVGHDGDHTCPTGDDDGVWAWGDNCHHEWITDDTGDSRPRVEFYTYCQLCGVDKPLD